jgi:chitodextrinase
MVRVLAAICLTLPFIPPASVAAAGVPCGDIQVVYARGAGFPVFGDDYNGFVTDALVPRLGTEASVSTHQLGQDGGFGGHVYTPSGDFSVLLQGIFPFLPGSAYDNSVIEGQSELVAYLIDRAATCPNEKYVLGGWSEGAQVVGQSLSLVPVEDRDRIAFVALFGDPKLQTGNFRGPFGLFSFPAACTPLGAPPWKRWPDCRLMGGYFGPRDPYVPNDIRLRVGSWCAFLDAACDGDTGHLPFAMLPPVNAHYSYWQQDGLMAQAAREAVDALKLFVPAHAASFDASWFQFVGGATGADLAIVFDTTGSMWGAIDDAKAQATDLAQRWLDFFHNGRVALIDFKDQGDPYVARVDLGLTSNIADFQTAVNDLTADGGGDYPEAELSGVMTALDGLDWRSGATKAEIVITDAPGKDPEPVTGYTRDQVAQHARSIDPVAIYGVNVSGGQDVSDFFMPLTGGTAGQVFVLQPGQSLADALFNVLDTVHFNPVATLNGPYLAETGSAIRFSTDGSFDADGNLVSYEWDFNNDGTVDQTTTTPFVDHAYPGEFHGVAAVRVVSSDGGFALATADVSVISSAELTNLAPIAPVSASASITGANEATVTWTPAMSDRADGYKVFLPDGTVVGLRLASDPHSVVVSGLDLSQPVVFEVAASNGYGNSAAVASPSVGGNDTTPPTTPGGLTAMAVSTGQVDLAWTASTDAVGVQGYKLYRNGAYLSSVGPVGSTSFSDTGLTANTAYSYRVSAIDAAGNESAQSTAAAMTTPASGADTTPPSAPGSATVTASAWNEVTVTWTAATDNVGVTSYAIYRGGTAPNTQTKIAAVSGATTSFVDWSVPPGPASPSVWYWVVAADAAGNTSTSASSSFFGLPLCTTCGTAVTVNPSADAYVDSGQSTTNFGTATSLKIAAASPIQHTYLAFDLTTLPPGTIAGVTLRLYQTSAGATSYSVRCITTSWTETTITYNNAPAPPHVVGTNPPEGPANPPSCLGSIGTSPAGAANTYVSTALLVPPSRVLTRYELTTTSGAATYQSREAVTKPQLVVNVVAPDAAAPSVPAGLSATAVSPGQINLAWTASSDDVGVQGYKLYRNGSYVGSLIGSPSFSDVGLTTGTAYTYAVSAIDAAGNESARSSTAGATTLPNSDTVPPSIPANVAAVATAWNVVNVTWIGSTDNVGVTSYVIFRGAAKLSTVSGSVTTFTDRSTAGSTTYSYTVRASDAAGNTSAASSAAGVTTPHR